MSSVKFLLNAAIFTGGITGCALIEGAAPVVSPGLSQQQLAEAWNAQQVVDGDSLVVVSNTGQQERVRLCGIDAPEQAQPLGEASRAHLQQLLAQSRDGQVILVPVEQDQYGRLVAEVFVPVAGSEEIHVNSQMAADSMAYVYERYVGGCPNGVVIQAAGAAAEAAGQGVWAGNPVMPWDFRRQN